MVKLDLWFASLPAIDFALDDLTAREQRHGDSSACAYLDGEAADLRQGQSDLRVEWNPVSGAKSYNLRRTESGNLNQTTTIYSGPNTVDQVTLVRYISDTFYYYAQACFGNQCSPWVQAPGVAGTTLTQTGKPEVAPAAGSTTQ